MGGRFAAPETNGLGIDDAVFDWARAVIALPLTDARSVRNAPAISMANDSSVFTAGGTQVQGFPGQIIAPAGFLSNEDLRAGDIPFRIELDIGLYVFLYLTLNAETYAMLAGSIALWIGLGIVMYLTRHIDWYSLGKGRRPDQAELFAGS